eukprot:scaffold5.g621.t1
MPAMQQQQEHEAGQSPSATKPSAGSNSPVAGPPCCWSQLESRPSSASEVPSPLQPTPAGLQKAISLLLSPDSPSKGHQSDESEGNGRNRERAAISPGAAQLPPMTGYSPGADREADLWGSDEVWATAVGTRSAAVDFAALQAASPAASPRDSREAAAAPAGQKMSSSLSAEARAQAGFKLLSLERHERHRQASVAGQPSTEREQRGPRPAFKALPVGSAARVARAPAPAPPRAPKPPTAAAAPVLRSAQRAEAHRQRAAERQRTEAEKAAAYEADRQAAKSAQAPTPAFKARPAPDSSRAPFRPDPSLAAPPTRPRPFRPNQRLGSLHS